MRKVLRSDARLSAKEQTIRHLAADLITRVPGQRLPTVLHYNQQLAVGTGTVQNALRYLEEVGAIRLTPRGHKGTLLEQADFGALWLNAGLGTVKLALGPQEAPEFYGMGVPIEQLGVELSPLSRQPTLSKLSEYSEACLAYDAQSLYIAALLRQVDVQAIAKTQKTEIASRRQEEQQLNEYFKGHDGIRRQDGVDHWL